MNESNGKKINKGKPRRLKQNKRTSPPPPFCVCIWREVAFVLFHYLFISFLWYGMRNAKIVNVIVLMTVKRPKESASSSGESKHQVFCCNPLSLYNKTNSTWFRRQRDWYQEKKEKTLTAFPPLALRWLPFRVHSTGTRWTCTRCARRSSSATTPLCRLITTRRRWDRSHHTASCATRRALLCKSD